MFDLRQIGPPTTRTVVGFDLTPGVVLKTALSMGLSVAGFCYLAIGKKEGDLQKMILGALMILGSVFVF